MSEDTPDRVVTEKVGTYSIYTADHVPVWGGGSNGEVQYQLMGLSLFEAVDFVLRYRKGSYAIYTESTGFRLCYTPSPLYSSDPIFFVANTFDELLKKVIATRSEWQASCYAKQDSVVFKYATRHGQF